MQWQLPDPYVNEKQSEVFLHRLLGEKEDVNKFGPKMDFLFPFSLKFSGTVLERQYQWGHILFSLLEHSFFRKRAHLLLPI